MDRQSEFVHHPHSNEQIRTEDYIAGLARWSLFLSYSQNIKIFRLLSWWRSSSKNFSAFT